MSDDNAYDPIPGAVPRETLLRDTTPGGVHRETILRETPIFKRMLGAIPPSEKEILDDADHGIAAAANGNAVKRSEARRDAVLAVALAIVRRGGNPTTDWTVKDTDTAYSIADMLAALT